MYQMILFAIHVHNDFFKKLELADSQRQIESVTQMLSLKEKICMVKISEAFLVLLWFPRKAILITAI